ncbi:MAG: alpha-amylase family glycosyl hydrolase [Hespellia sp.]|nr:alpha-amylase family glycosyl hydrolase [Hespellia sp.]
MRRGQGYAAPLGISVNGNRVNFAIHVPKEKKCELRLYKKGDEVPDQIYKMPEKDAIGTVRFLEVSDFDFEDYEYNFYIDEVPYVEPYARELTGRKTFGEEMENHTNPIHARISAGPYEWNGDHPLNIPYHEVVAYSLHVRGFTKHRSSKVKHKGTFAGVAEKIPYLKELGINQIQCMPIYEFEDRKKNYTNYWGYGSGFYFAPKESYAAGDSAVNELKDMIRQMHQAGIEVVLYFPFEEGIRTQLVEKCLEYYVLEYHVDGFILNPYNAPMQSIKQNPLLANTKIMKKEERFQNVMRQFLKGDEGMVSDVMWALRRNTGEDGVYNYITDHTGFTLQDVVSYDGKHNEKNGEQNQDGPDYNYSWNCGAEGPSRKKAVVQLRKNQVRNAFFLLLTAQGMPCILAGDEFGNTQNGNNNVYCQDNETAWQNWSKCREDSELLQYVKDLIQLRRDHPILHKENQLLGTDQTSCGIPDVSYHGESAWRVPAIISSRQLGVMYSGAAMKDDECFVAYNMHWLSHTYALPSLPDRKKWYQVLDTKDGLLPKCKLLKNQKLLEVEERTAVFLVGK